MFFRIFYEIAAIISIVYFLSINVVYADDCAGSTCTVPIGGNEINLTRNHATETITLKSNPTTGYVWEVANYDAKLVTISHRYQSECKEKMVGCGGHDDWTITAKPEAFATAPHRITVTLMYHRPWEKNVPPAEEKKIIITIKA